MKLLRLKSVMFCMLVMVAALDLAALAKELVVTACAGTLSAGISIVAEPWAERTGTSLVVNEIPFTEIRSKVLTSLRLGIYVGDVLCVPADVLAELITYVKPVPEWIKEALAWDDILPAYRESLLNWGGVTYAYPLDGDLFLLFYRRDVFENEGYQALFQERYDRRLTPPTTWEEYREVAQFLTGWDWDKSGLTRYGCVELLRREEHLFHGFSARAAAYMKHPDNPGFYFDPDTMEPLIDSPGFVKALEDWIEVIRCCMPPGALGYSWIENVQSVVSGEAAMVIQWTDVGPMSVDPAFSMISHLVGYAPLPGRDEVWNYRTKNWERIEGGNHPAYLGFGGWVLVVPKDCRDFELALEFVLEVCSSESLKKLSTMSGSGVNPIRKSTLEDKQAWLAFTSTVHPDVTVPGFAEDEAEAYLGAIMKALESPNYIQQLRLPGYIEYASVLEHYLALALIGQMSAAEALRQAAIEWNAITNRLGRENQRRLYRESLGLPVE